jgi:hypothetical protein
MATSKQVRELACAKCRSGVTGVARSASPRDHYFMRIQPGQWYFAVACRNERCRRIIVVTIAESPLTAEEIASDKDYFEAVCDACGTYGRWLMCEWSHLRAPGLPSAGNDNRR